MDTRIPSREEIDALSEVDYKVLENRLRRAAQRQGLRLVKSRRRDWRAADYGSYWLVQVARPKALIGDRNIGMTLHGVASFLWGEDGDWWRSPVEAATV
jgi:hypothetical protein